MLYLRHLQHLALCVANKSAFSVVCVLGFHHRGKVEQRACGSRPLPLIDAKRVGQTRVFSMELEQKVGETRMEHDRKQSITQIWISPPSL